jgi:hypothetical protein
MLFDLAFPCYLTTFSGKKCLSGKVICAFLCPAYRSSPVLFYGIQCGDVRCIFGILDHGGGKSRNQCLILQLTSNGHHPDPGKPVVLRICPIWGPHAIVWQRVRRRNYPSPGGLVRCEGIRFEDCYLFSFPRKF